MASFLETIVKFTPQESSAYKAKTMPLSAHPPILSQNEQHVTFCLSNEQSRYVYGLEEVTKYLIRGNGVDETTKGWIPLSERLAGWIVENRQRKSNGNFEMFYKHPNVNGTLRSWLAVKFYICHGFIPTVEERKKSKEGQYCLVVASEKVRGLSFNSRKPWSTSCYKEHQKVVEAFYCESYNILQSRDN